MMRELLPAIQAWRGLGEDAALATVVKTWGSSPRPLGAKMAVSSSRQMVGSVSGGCVEAAVVAEALDVIATGVPRLVTYGVDDETAWGVGLSCGGSLEVFIEPLIEPLAKS